MKMVTGKSLAEAVEILPEDLVEALDGLPGQNQHCAELAVITLQNALENLPAANQARTEVTD